MGKENLIHVDFGTDKEVMNIAVNPRRTDVATAFVYDNHSRKLDIYLLQWDGFNYQETAILHTYKVANRDLAKAYAEQIPEMSAIELMIMHLPVHHN